MWGSSSAFTPDILQKAFCAENGIRYSEKTHLCSRQIEPPHKYVAEDNAVEKHTYSYRYIPFFLLFIRFS